MAVLQPIPPLPICPSISTPASALRLIINAPNFQVGIEHEPQAKLGTVAILVPVLFGYNHLYTRLQNPRQLVRPVPICPPSPTPSPQTPHPTSRTQVLIVGLFYAALFALIAAMANSAIASVKVQREMGTVPEYGHWLGWLVYWTIESYGSVVVPMLWSTTASITDSKAATIVYPLIVIFQQLGAVGGATLATYTKFFGFQSLVFFHALSIGLIVVLVRRALDINDVRVGDWRMGGGAHSPSCLSLNCCVLCRTRWGGHWKRPPPAASARRSRRGCSRGCVSSALAPTWPASLSFPLSPRLSAPSWIFR